jgi:hypothetical protein
MGEVLGGGCFVFSNVPRQVMASYFREICENSLMQFLKLLTSPP